MNTNCLEGIKCPDCGNEESFMVTVTGITKVTDDGTDHVTDLEWAEDAPTICNQCQRTGKWNDFLAPKFPHQITITFNADRPLTDVEKSSLIAALETQVQEPVVIEGPDRDWENAEWSSSKVEADIFTVIE
jgi:hypothetical protein